MLLINRTKLTGAVVFFALTACSGSGDSGDNNADSEEPASLHVRAHLPLEILLGDFREDLVITAEVTGQDIRKSTNRFSINRSFKSKNPAASSRHFVSGSLDVPPGSNRTFTLRAYQDGSETYRGSVVTDILPTDNPTVRITLKSLEDPTASVPKVIEATIGSGSVVVTPHEIICPVNGWRQLSAKNELDEVIDGDVEWESSDPFVATVSQTGLVTITGEGKALITATSGKLSKSINVSGVNSGKQDITFFMTADPQYHLGKEGIEKGWDGTNQRKLIAEMNRLPGKRDGFCNLNVARPRGVLVAGDLTQNGYKSTTLRPPFWKTKSYEEFDRYKEEWGLSNSDGSNNELRFRVFEGYGNHDDLNGKGNSPDPLDYKHYCGDSNNEFTDKCTNPIINEVRKRNRTRATWVGSGLRGFWSDNFTREGPEGGNNRWNGGLHYSWDWEGVHFVSVNLYGGQRGSDGSQNFPRNASRFLKNDLEKRVGNSGRPVVIMQHVGFEQWSTMHPSKIKKSVETWSCEERSKLAAITAPYNVIAYFSGHEHVPLNRSVSHDGIINYTSGAARQPSPKVTVGGKKKYDYRGGFLVVRLVGNQFHIQLRRRTEDGWKWDGGDSWELPMPRFAPSEPVSCI